ncbi:response regulator transcription factor [Kutzneria sp. CA-103260]|uniref:response regulator transcription factor n=1 Tax=Kutzneria sp. CA-103260 TaxID=2802641 RepID=UPI001BF162EE|nr:response regulator transcription factor [Kutzneria sp. CA-103260]QUQ71259.1 LuxR family transcriptional regulator [Kutzneria sp. CA-103260]
MNRLVVAAHAEDPITLGGVLGCLDGRPDLTVVRHGQRPRPDVLVVCVPAVSGRTLALLRRVAETEPTRVVLVTSQLRDVDVLPLVERGVVGVLPIAAATPERLARAVFAAAAGQGQLPPTLLGQLLGQIAQVQRDVLRPRGLVASGMADRELDVVRLLAEGLDSGQIGRRLGISERAVKNVIEMLQRRLGLRNRPHAVAAAMRSGLL